MKKHPNTPRLFTLADGLAVGARVLLAAILFYFGASKAAQSEDFLKAVRAYGFLDSSIGLNFAAIVVPWLEIFFGCLLLLGVAVRGTALAAAVLLLFFTGLILVRAMEIGAATHQALCAISFDCGCGSGEVRVCPKLLENIALIGVATWLSFGRSRRGCLRFRLLRDRSTV